MRLRTLIPFLLAVSAAPVRAQDWDRYQPGLLSTIITAHEPDLRAQGGPGKPHWGLSGEDFPTKATLIYTGEHRPLSAERRSILERWQKSFGVDAAVLDAFVNEYRFRQDSLDVWLAVQKQLEAPLAKEATPGKPLTTLTTFIGGYYDGGEVSWLFLMNEYDATGP